MNAARVTIEIRPARDRHTLPDLGFLGINKRELVEVPDIPFSKVEADKHSLCWVGTVLNVDQLPLQRSS